MGRRLVKALVNGPRFLNSNQSQTVTNATANASVAFYEKQLVYAESLMLFLSGTEAQARSPQQRQYPCHLFNH